tara:strand:- start:465 stop:1238 length:774 start_codon:yes stop_codon:yes gene_type:complete
MWNGNPVAIHTTVGHVPSQDIAASGDMRIFTTAIDSSLEIATPDLILNTAISSTRDSVPFNSPIATAKYNSSTAIASINTSSLRGGELVYLADEGADITSYDILGYRLNFDLTTDPTGNFYDRLYIQHLLDWPEDYGIIPLTIVIGDYLLIGSELIRITNINESYNSGGWHYYRFSVERGAIDVTTGLATTIVYHEKQGTSAAVDSMLTVDGDTILKQSTTNIQNADGQMYVYQPYSAKWKRLQFDTSGDIVPGTVI